MSGSFPERIERVEPGGARAAARAARRVGRAYALRCDASALAWHAALLGAYAALATGRIAPGWFVLVGLCAYVRNFNALHQLSHAPRAHRSPLSWLRPLAIIVHGPAQVGYDELARNHALHHASPGDPERDPDAYLNAVPWPLALVNAVTQPEQMLVRFAAREGWSPRLTRRQALNVAVFVAITMSGGPRGLLYWILTTRLASAAVWFVFDWVLHHPRCWGRLDALPLPSPLRAVWRVLFGRDNLNAVLYHAVHHQVAAPDADLPAIAASLRAEAAPRRGLQQHAA